MTELKEFQELVRLGVVYCPEMGWCLRKDRSKVLGYVSKEGRYQTQSPCKGYENRRWVALDRFIYWFHYGIIPYRISHINGDKTDCYIENLQEKKKVNGIKKLVIGEKPNNLEIENHKKEIINLQETPVVPDWIQKRIDAGKWLDKEKYYELKKKGQPTWVLTEEEKREREERQRWVDELREGFNKAFPLDE